MKSLTFLLVFTMIPIFISIICIPYWTRRTESFGVSIPEEVYHHPRTKKLRKNYVLVSGLFSLIVMIIFFVSAYIGEALTAGILFPLLIIMYVVGSAFIYLPFHQKMRIWKEEHPEWNTKPTVITVDTSFRKHKLVHTNKWFILSFALTFITMIVTLIGYDRIPDKIPMQYNFTGEVTSWADKSYRTALLFPILQFYLTLIFLFVNTIIKKAKQQVDANKPEESVQRNIIFRRRWSFFTIVNGTGLVILFTIIQMGLLFPIHEMVVMISSIVYTFVVIGWAIILSFTTGQGGSRLKGKTIAVKNKHGNVINRDDDKYWKLGIFYFNKNDPTIFLEKRFGVGWTNNWAHPVSWIILLAILSLALGIPFFLTR